MKKALLIVDVQNDYFPGGSMELVSMDAAAANCRNLLESFRSEGLPIFHVQHFSTRPGATFFIPDTDGCKIHECVNPIGDEPVISKNYPSAFRDTGLDKLLHESGVDELVICGAMTHMCIDTTTRAAFDLGYKCVVVNDACATRNLEFDGKTVSADLVQAAFMAALSVPFATVLTSSNYLAGDQL